MALGPEPSGTATPQPGEIPAVGPSASEDPTGGERSLVDDLADIFDDLQTFVHAEIAFQKTRAAFVADRVKTTLALAIAAAFVVVLATIGLTVGLIFALTPLVTAWGATAIVVGAQLLVAYLLLQKAGATWRGMKAEMAAAEQEIDDEHPESGTHG